MLWVLAEKSLPKKNAGDYNQALMDLGAAICVPKNPRCLICPLMKVCRARENGTQDQRPVKLPRKVVPHHIHVAGVIVRRIGNPPHAEVLLARRPSKGLLGGMWEFPNGRVNGDPLAGLASVLKMGYNLRLREKRSKVRKTEAIGLVHHGYSHFSVSVHIYPCEVVSAARTENLNWVSLKDLGDYPMGRIDRQIADMIRELHVY